MVLYHPFNSESRISAMHRQFNLFDWFPYIRAHIGVNCLKLTGRCIWLACNGPPWHSIISRVNSCLSIQLSFSLIHLCVGMLYGCLWGNAPSPCLTQLCKMVTEWTELCFRSRKTEFLDSSLHYGNIKVTRNQCLFPKTVYPWNLSFIVM